MTRDVTYLGHPNKVHYWESLSTLLHRHYHVPRSQEVHEKVMFAVSQEDKLILQQIAINADVLAGLSLCLCVC